MFYKHVKNNLFNDPPCNTVWPVIIIGTFIGLAGLVIFVLVLMSTTPAVADDINSYEPSNTQQPEQSAELAKIRKIIEGLQKELGSAHTIKDKLHKELRDQEKIIGRITQQIKKLDRQLQHQKKQLAQQVRREKKLRLDLFQHKDTLKQQVRTAYSIGKQDYLKLLLNQQDPGSIGRILSYYDYFIRVRASNINTVKDKITAVRELQLSIKEKRIELKDSREERAREINSLEQSKKNRKLVLARLNKEIRTKSQKLDKMREDEKRLQRLVTQLQNALTDIPDSTERLIDFASQKGKLQWPSEGRIRKRYGSARETGKLKWQGVVINAKEGSQVTAISHGQVAFADWLQGYGLLIIIDHGDNYMSLYGFNQNLLKEPGDWIETGEIIATAGNSGGHTKPGVYFEIRHNGKPINPVLWCSNKINKKSARR